LVTGVLRVTRVPTMSSALLLLVGVQVVCASDINVVDASDSVLASGALQLAVDGTDGWFAVISKVFAKDGFEVNAEVVLDDGRKATPLMVALAIAAEDAERGQQGLTLVNELLARPNIDVNAAAAVDGTPLAPVTPLWTALHLWTNAWPSREPESQDVETSVPGPGALMALRALLAHKNLEVNTRGVIMDELMTPLFLASMGAANEVEGGLDVVSELLACDSIDVNAGVQMADGGAASPLHMALPLAAEGVSGALRVVSVLLEREEAQVNSPGTMSDGERFTPLHIMLMANLHGTAGALELGRTLMLRHDRYGDLDVHTPLQMPANPDGEAGVMSSPLLMAADALIHLQRQEMAQKNKDSVEESSGLQTHAAKEILWRLAKAGARLAETDMVDEPTVKMIEVLLESQANAMKAAGAKAAAAVAAGDQAKEEL